MNEILIIAIVISVLTVANICLFAVTSAARDKCKEYYRECQYKCDLCELYQNDCERNSEILYNFLQKIVAKNKEKEGKGD